MPKLTEIKVRLDSAAPDAPWTLPSALPPPEQMLCCDARTLEAWHRDSRGERRRWRDPLEALRWMETSIREYATVRPDAKWVGYLSYDLGRLFESLPAASADDGLGLPLFAFTLHSAHDEHQLPVFPETPSRAREDPLRSNFTRRGYCAAVERAIEYIRAGDVFQVNLSQRFTAGLTAPPALVYDRLRELSPAAYGACLQYGDFALLCNSPELFLRVTPDPVSGRRRVVTRPVKGTRPRAPGMDVELRESGKDQAELNMIVDLERNDLGRVCEIGSVKVTEPRTIEAHPTVYHGVATVEGNLRHDVSFVDLLRATFPGGSVTGAPKIRAMQIINELEPVRRGPYCGAIGYLSADGSMEFNVAIRTMIVNDGLVHVPVGGGVVADSTPAGEYEETLVKARAMFAALGVSADDIG
jgi:para-aminobenzoate synthetase component 1